MENLGGWDQTEDHPDFDPNLLNVESWNVDHQPDDDDDDDQLPVDPHDGRRRKKSWGESGRRTAIDQWSASLGVPDYDPTHNSQQPQGVTIKQGRSSAPGVGNHPMSNTVNATTNSSNLHRVVGIPTETVEAAVEAAVAAISEPSNSVTSGDRSGGSTNPNRMTRHLHPLGIQSSASCPAPAHSGGQAFPQQPQVQPQHIQQRQPVPLHHHHHHHQPGQQQQQPQQQPQQHTLQVSASTTSTPTITNSTPASAQHLNSLQANFMLAQAANSSIAAAAAAAAAAGAGATNSATVISQPSTKAPAPARRRGGTRTKVASAAKSTKKKKKASTGTTAASGTAATGDATATAAAATAAASGTLPPFYLFDAPIELRANFMQNQRRLGLPIQHDPNSYHYGETVNGFHPHQYQIPFGANSSNGTATAASGNVLRPANLPPPQLIDARHGNHRKNKGGQVKNEREQKRAQKITELIEQLRLQMEDGGWQVEARSKFHTLSNCAQYIKHMINLTKEKENKNSKLNVELDEKRRKLEREKEEKAMQEGRSDPESVTSSLTSDTSMSTARHKQAEEGDKDGSKKRKLPDAENNGGGSSGDDSNQNSSNNEDADNKQSNKKHRISSEAPTEDSSGDDNRADSGTGSGSGNSRTGSGTGSGSGSGNSRTGSGSGGSGSGGISKTISSVSELTDSNRGSSSNNSGSGGGSSDDLPTEQDSNESKSGNQKEVAVDQPSTSSISSDAAVASEKTSRDRNTGHKDVVFNNKSRKRPPEEVTSLERTFELNYEEVFHKSNIPQLIASTSGKVVTWNECFCKATGYRKSEIERMTIFSLVKPENLANFFEIVAAALRPDDEEVAKETKLSDDAKSDEEKKGTEESSASNNSASTKSEKLVTESASSSQDSLSGHDTVVCSNNEKEGVTQQVGVELQEVEKSQTSNENGTEGSKEEKKDTEKNISENVIVSGNSANEESSSNSNDEEGTSKMDTDKSSNEESSNSSEGDSNNKTDSDNVSGNSTNEEVSSNSTGDNDPGTQTEQDATVKAKESTTSTDDTKEETKPEANDTVDTDQSQKRSEEIMSKRLLNYTAMTLPCIDFPAMIKRNQAACEANAPIIPPLHVTVTLMPDKDPRRCCFHCVFTNSKGTNGSLGIITPELLASLFSQPLGTSRRKKSKHQHQRKRSWGGTTRVGQSVSMASKTNEDEQHSVEHIVSTNNAGEPPPSPLLMPPPGPLAEDTSKKEGEKAMQVEKAN